jgi:hypothetical protein
VAQMIRLFNAERGFSGHRDLLHACGACARECANRPEVPLCPS